MVVRRTCHAADGTAYIGVGWSFGNASSTSICDASTGELVALSLVSDVNEHCRGSAYQAYYGTAQSDAGGSLDDCAFVDTTGALDERGSRPRLYPDGGTPLTPVQCVIDD